MKGGDQLQAAVGAVFLSLGIGFQFSPWAGVISLGAVVLFDVFVDPWRPRR